MSFKVEVKGISAWSYGGRVYRQGVHVVDDESVVYASLRVLRGHDRGHEYGVFVSNTDETPTDTAKTYHDYPQHPLPARAVHNAVEVQPGVFEPVDKAGKKSKAESPADTDGALL